MNVVSGVPSPQPTPDNSRQMDSGLECLAIIGNHYRRAVDREHLKHELNLQDRLVIAQELAKAAHMVGLKARLFRSKPLKSLVAAPVHQSSKLRWICDLARRGRGPVAVAAPHQRAARTLTVEEFKSEWTGTFILVTRRPDGWQIVLA